MKKDIRSIHPSVTRDMDQAAAIDEKLELIRKTVPNETSAAIRFDLSWRIALAGIFMSFVVFGLFDQEQDALIENTFVRVAISAVVFFISLGRYFEAFWKCRILS